MDYVAEINQYLSTCSGRVIDVFYELYQIIKGVDDEQQGGAVQYLMEHVTRTESDETVLAKEHYTQKQIETISRKLQRGKLQEFIDRAAGEASKAGADPLEFYTSIWGYIKGKYGKSDRECASALFTLADSSMIPYKAVGTGLTLDNEKYREIARGLRGGVLDEVEYILKLSYDQKTQAASLLADRLLSVEDEETRAVLMSLFINAVEDRMKNKLRQSVEEL